MERMVQLVLSTYIKCTKNGGETVKNGEIINFY